MSGLIARVPCLQVAFASNVPDCGWFSFQHEFEPAENMKKEEASGMSKSAQRRKKKKDAKERAKQEAIAEVSLLFVAFG